MSWREQIGVEELKRERPPRGAIVIVAIGLVACVVAVLASAGKGEGEAAHLEFVQEGTLADSEPVTVPGGSQKMRLLDGLIRATGTNVSGYSLFQVATVLRIEEGAPVGESRVLCSISAPHGSEIGQTSGGLRALFPRSSEGGIFKQEVPETVLIDFSSHGSELAVLEVADLPSEFTNERGVKLEWPEFEEGTEHLKYFISGGKPKHDLLLHPDHQRRQGDGGDARRAQTPLAADRRRSGRRRTGTPRRGRNGEGRRNRRSGRRRRMRRRAVAAS
jgi:hypothetical protein